MNKINRWVIGTLPFTILFCYIIFSWFESNFYFLFGAACVVLFIANLVSNKQFVIHSYTFLIFLFGLYIIYSNAYIAQNKFIVYNEVFKNQYIYSFFVLNIIENTKFSKKTITIWFRVFEITIWVTFFVMMMQQFYDRDFLQNKKGLETLFEQSYLSQAEFRMLSIYSWSGLLDLMFYFVPITFFVINYKLNHNKVFQALLYTAILIVVCVFSKSRSSMIAAAPVIFILQNSYQKKNISAYYNRMVIITTLLFTTYIAFTNIPMLTKILDDRILETSKGELENRTMNTRLIAFEAFAKCFPDAPLLGAGNTKYASGGIGRWNFKLDTFLAGRSAQIHVGLIDLFYLYGLVGGSFFAIFSVITLRKLYRKSKIYNFRAVFWGLMALPIANFGIVSFNVMSAGLLLSFVLCKNLDVFCEIPDAAGKKKLPTEKDGLPSESISYPAPTSWG